MYLSTSKGNGGEKRIKPFTIEMNLKIKKKSVCLNSQDAVIQPCCHEPPSSIAYFYGDAFPSMLLLHTDDTTVV